MSVEEASMFIWVWIKDHTNIISGIKDLTFDESDEHFTFCFPQLVPTVKWKYDYIIFKRKVDGKN